MTEGLCFGMWLLHPWFFHMLLVMLIIYFRLELCRLLINRTIVTSAADGQVRIGQVAENGHVNTEKLGKHHGRVHKLAVEPGNPHILYSCGEDGVVQHFDLRINLFMNLFRLLLIHRKQQSLFLKQLKKFQNNIWTTWKMHRRIPGRGIR